MWSNLFQIASYRLVKMANTRFHCPAAAVLLIQITLEALEYLNISGAVSHHFLQNFIFICKIDIIYNIKSGEAQSMVGSPSLKSGGLGPPAPLFLRHCNSRVLIGMKSWKKANHCFQAWKSHGKWPRMCMIQFSSSWH